MPLSRLQEFPDPTLKAGCCLTFFEWPACGAVLLVLVACGPAPPRQQNSIVDQKKLSDRGTIKAGDFLATPQNCGMISGDRPVYPKQARAARIQGVVRVGYRITKTGEVRDLHALSGNPALIPAALAAIAKWRFAPCRLFGGEPVEVRSQSNVDFTLNQ